MIGAIPADRDETITATDQGGDLGRISGAINCSRWEKPRPALSLPPESRKIATPCYPSGAANRRESLPVKRIDRLVVASPNWAAFWTVPTSATSVDPGEAFERVTQLYLQSRPEYRTQLEHVWCVPDEVRPRTRQQLNLPTTDEGIDLLAQTRDRRMSAQFLR